MYLLFTITPTASQLYEDISVSRSYDNKETIIQNFAKRELDKSPGHLRLVNDTMTEYPRIEGAENLAIYNYNKGYTLLQCLHIDQVKEI